MCIFKLEVKTGEGAVLSLEENTARVNSVWVNGGRRKPETVIFAPGGQLRPDGTS